MTKTFRYQHLRSAVRGAKPDSSVIREGEIAVNLSKDNEKLFLKNTDNTVIEFIPEAQIDAKIASQSGTTDSKIQVLSGAIDSLDTKVDGVSGAVDTALATKVANDTYTAYTAATNAAIALKANSADVYTKTQTYTKTEVDTNIANFFDGALYETSGTSKVINFYHGNSIKATIDATDFIKDGMVQNVEIKNVTSGASQVTCLVITFNTDSGKEDINIPIANIFDATNYYTKAEINAYSAATATAISEKLASAAFNTYSAATKTAIDGKLATSDFKTYSGATKTAIDAKLPISNFETYSGAVDTLIGTKAAQSDLNTLSGTVTAHTADTGIHVTTSDKSTWSAKQDALVSGTNIKTIQGNSVLGSGNIELGVGDLKTNGITDFTIDGDTVILDAGTFN